MNSFGKPDEVPLKWEHTNSYVVETPDATCDQIDGLRFTLDNQDVIGLADDMYKALTLFMLYHKGAKSIWRYCENSTVLNRAIMKAEEVFYKATAGKRKREIRQEAYQIESTHCCKCGKLITYKTEGRWNIDEAGINVLRTVITTRCECGGVKSYLEADYHNKEAIAREADERREELVGKHKAAFEKEGVVK